MLQVIGKGKSFPEKSAKTQVVTPKRKHGPTSKQKATLWQQNEEATKRRGEKSLHMTQVSGN